MTDFTGGTFADLFLELDTPEIITLEADCCSFADQAWTERDQDEGKLFGDRINARRSAWGCIPPFFSHGDDEFCLGEFYASIDRDFAHFLNEDAVCFAGDKAS